MKAYPDRKARQAKDKNNHALADDDEMGVSPFTGDQTPGLRLMEVVEGCRLQKGHTFQEKDVLHLRVAEEANLRQIFVVIKRSDNRCFGKS